MKTQILTTRAGTVVKVSLDLVNYDAAVRRAEKKLGAKLVLAGPSDGDINILLIAGSEAAKIHFTRAAAKRMELSGVSARHRAIQSRAAKALKLKVAAAGHDVHGLGAFEAAKKYNHALPKGAGKLWNLAAWGIQRLIPTRVLPLA